MVWQQSNSPEVCPNAAYIVTLVHGRSTIQQTGRMQILPLHQRHPVARGIIFWGFLSHPCEHDISRGNILGTNVSLYLINTKISESAPDGRDVQPQG